MSAVTRVEVIGDGGRYFTALNLENVELSYQDDGRTLKVFITESTTPTNAPANLRVIKGDK